MRAVLAIAIAIAIALAGAGEAARPRMIAVPAGRFEMGSLNAGDEQPIHAVAVEAFEIDATEVTAAAYDACVAAGACTPAATWSRCTSGVPSRADHPINCVEWTQAEAYCRWAGKRLPTEEKSEHAARGADSGQ